MDKWTKRIKHAYMFLRLLSPHESISKNIRQMSNDDKNYLSVQDIHQNDIKNLER